MNQPRMRRSGLLMLASILAFALPPAFARAEEATPASGAPGETLLAVTIDRAQLPGEGGFLVLGRATYEPGARRTLPAAVGTMAVIVESGILTYEVETGGRIIRGANTAHPGEEPAPAATPIALAAGDALVFPAQRRIESNADSEPAVFLWAIVLEPTGNPPSEPTDVGEVSIEEIAYLPELGTALADGPITLAVRSVSLAPGQALAAPPGGIQAAGAASAEAGLLASRADGAVTNPGDAPIDVLVLSLAPGALPARAQDAATPDAGRAHDPIAVVWETMGGPDLPLADPFELAIDPRGNLWVADGRNSRFQIFAPDGTFLEAWGTPGSGEGEFDFVRESGDGLGAIGFDADGAIYVVDTGNHRVQKFDAARQFVTAWGGEGEDDGQFLDPIGIAIGPDGLVYVIDDEREDVQVFAAAGAFRLKFGGFGIDPGQMLDAGSGIAFDRDGNLLAVDFGNHRVQRFAPDGTFLEAWGSFGVGEGRFINPNDVAVDGEGRVYVVDAGNTRVQVFAPDGAFLAAWGKFTQPAAIVLDGHGNAYVSDRVNARIQKFQLAAPLTVAAAATPAP